MPYADRNKICKKLDQVENYEQAKIDNFKGWILHHKQGLYMSIEEMEELGWDRGQDDEELFELAMHPEQYRAYKSGKAKADFEKDLAERKAKKNAPAASEMPKQIKVSVNGQTYEVNIAYGNDAPAATPASAAPVAATFARYASSASANPLVVSSANASIKPSLDCALSMLSTP